MPDREHRVREIAHRLWEQEGCPSDQDKRHWATAEQILDAQERTDATMARDQAKGKRTPARRAGKRTAARPHAGATTAH
jgi:Protein of unknown function (DUF2934)